MGQDTTTGTVQEPIDRTVILQRIDVIAQELCELRRLVDRLFPSRSSALALQLLGCLGPEPLEAYDYDLDWSRFTHR